MIITGCGPIKKKKKSILTLLPQIEGHIRKDGFMQVLVASIDCPFALARRCGDATNAEVRCQFTKRELEVNRRGLNTMSNNGDIRYCHKFSYVFLKFLLFFYAIVFWVS